MDCTKKVIDVFATATHKKDGGDMDEVWQGPVWSVELRYKPVPPVLAPHPSAITEPSQVEGIDALVANWKTPWIMTSDQLWNVWELEVGDLVRVGDIGTNGYTDYCTVLEKVKVDRIGSAIDTGLPMRFGITELLDGAHTLPVPTVADGVVTYHFKDFTQTPTSHPTIYAYRLNRSIDATTPTKTPEHHTKGSTENEILLNRHDIRINTGWALNSEIIFPDNDTFSPATPANVAAAERKYKQMLFPLYKVRPISDEIVVQLDRGIKAVHWIKLWATTMVNKRQAGFSTAHEFMADDWAALHIREVSGEVISNNIAAQGAFCILHCGNHDDSTTGAIEVHEQESGGLTTHVFEQPKTDLRSLTISLRDRLNRPAHLGRIHLWFKLCVSHG